MPKGYSMNKKITFVIFSLLIFFILEAKERDIARNSSSYTSIAEKDCQTLDSDDVGSIQECESFNDIRVKVIEGDLRKSIVLIRQHREYNLNFWSIVSPFFSFLGDKIEWRHEIGHPEKVKGMIVRFEASDNFNNFDKTSSYLVVSKITKNKICVVAKVLPSENQNEIARKILDRKKVLPCLKAYENF